MYKNTCCSRVKPGIRVLALAASEVAVSGEGSNEGGDPTVIAVGMAFATTPSPRDAISGDTPRFSPVVEDQVEEQDEGIDGKEDEYIVGTVLLETK